VKYMFVVVAALIGVGALAQTSDDEKIIRQLEQEWIMHTGASKADIDFAKRIMPEKSIMVDNVGRISEFSVSDIEKMAKADPDVKSSGEITDLKVHFYGSDTAIATYKSHFIQMGHQDKKYDMDLNSASFGWIQ